MIDELDDRHIYEPISEVQSIVSMLVENIYNDENYQKYLGKLEQSTESDKKKAFIIKKTFSGVRVFNTNKDPLFLARDIGILMGISHISTLIKSYNNTEKITGYLKKGEKIKEVNFLTRHGVYRAMFNGRTKLADVFRGFIYKLIDYMNEYQKDKVIILADEFIKENPDLVHDATNELNENYKKYKQLYEIVKRERELWELKAEREHIKRIESEVEKNDIDITNTYNEMYIKQLHTDKEKMVEKIYQIKYDKETDKEEEEINILKKKFLKEVNIYLINPSFIESLFMIKSEQEADLVKDPIKELIKKKNKSNKALNKILDVSKEDKIIQILLPDEKKLIKPIINDSFNFDEETEFFINYKSFYKYNIEKFSNKENINLDEILYYVILFKSKNAIEHNNLIHIQTEWVLNKESFNSICEALKVECSFFRIPGTKKSSNDFIYKTSLENIKALIHDAIINI
jgi:hypothetical protein